MFASLSSTRDLRRTSPATQITEEGLERLRAASGKLMRQPTVSSYLMPIASQELRAALEPTPIPQTSYDTLGGGGHRSAWSTWFEVAHPLAPFNRAMEVMYLSDLNINLYVPKTSGAGRRVQPECFVGAPAGGGLEDHFHPRSPARAPACNIAAPELAYADQPCYEQTTST